MNLAFEKEPEGDLGRILSLPKRKPVDCDREPITRRYMPKTQALIEVMTEKFSLGPRKNCKCAELGYACITSLNAVQAWALREMMKAGGLLGLMGVGSGKTILGILAPLAFPDCKTALLLAEPSQRLHYKMFYLRLREHFRVPSIIFDTNDYDGTFIAKKSDGAPVPALHFRPYSLLSQPKSTDMLEMMAPDLIIADEAHRLASRKSSRTNRFLRYVSANEKARLCAWSGTLVKKTIGDISHLSAFSLGMNSPYPLEPNEVELWSDVLDPKPMPDRHSKTAKALHNAFGFDARSGLQKRVVQTYGVVTTTSSSASAAIYLHERKAPEIPENVKQALAGVRNSALRPDGEELVEAFEIARCAREVGSGFHYYWHYPEYARAKTDDERVKVSTKISNWFQTRKEFSKELRLKLLHPSTHLDSPMLCTNAAQRAYQQPAYDGDLPVWPSEKWPAWAELKDEVQHESRAAWLSDYLAHDAAAWGREHKGVIWYMNAAFGKKIAELLGVHCHGGGPDAERAIMAEDGTRPVVASIKAHGSGRDGLQLKFAKQLIAEVPSSNATFEQLLGRLCREGQKADVIDTWIYLHVHENKDALRAAIREAQFVEASTGNQQLLLMCDREFPL